MGHPAAISVAAVSLLPMQRKAFDFFFFRRRRLKRTSATVAEPAKK
jgi:hypothetical protein